MKKLILLCLLIVGMLLVVGCETGDTTDDLEVLPDDVEIEPEEDEGKALAGEASRRYSRTAKYQRTYDSCVDFDGGVSPYIPGIVYLEYTHNGVPRKFDYVDRYSTKYGKLFERTCKPDFVAGQAKSPLGWKKVDCPNGYDTRSIVSDLTGKTRTVSYCKCASDTDCGGQWVCDNGECIGIAEEIDCDVFGKLLLGETQDFTVDSTTYEINFTDYVYQNYAGGVKQVELSVNGEIVKMQEGESYMLADGGEVKLLNFLYQDYAGGVKQAEFCLNGPMDLSDYPKMFIVDTGTYWKYDGFFVVGQAAASSDNLAMIDVAANMKYEGVAVSMESVTRLDFEVEDVYAQNIITIGHSCVNTVSAVLSGNPQICNDGYEPGKAKIKLFRHENGNYAMLVAGYNNDDTRLAAKVIANRADELSGMEVEVEGTTWQNAVITEIN